MDSSSVSQHYVPALPQRLFDLQSQLAFINGSIASRTTSTDLRMLKIALEGLRVEAESELHAFLSAVATHSKRQTNASLTSSTIWMNQILQSRRDTLSAFGHRAVRASDEGDSFMSPWDPPQPYREPIQRTFDHISVPRNRNLILGPAFHALMARYRNPGLETRPQIENSLASPPVTEVYDLHRGGMPTENGSEPPAYLCAESFDSYAAHHPARMQFC